MRAKVWWVFFYPFAHHGPNLYPVVPWSTTPSNSSSAALCPKRKTPICTSENFPPAWKSSFGNPNHRSQWRKGVKNSLFVSLSQWGWGDYWVKECVKLIRAEYTFKSEVVWPQKRRENTDDRVRKWRAKRMLRREALDTGRSQSSGL